MQSNSADLEAVVHEIYVSFADQVLKSSLLLQSEAKTVNFVIKIINFEAIIMIRFCFVL